MGVFVLLDGACKEPGVSVNFYRSEINHVSRPVLGRYVRKGPREPAIISLLQGWLSFFCYQLIILFGSLSSELQLKSKQYPLIHPPQVCMPPSLCTPELQSRKGTLINMPIKPKNIKKKAAGPKKKHTVASCVACSRSVVDL